MRLDTFQQLRLEQKLKLAPRMIQSMEILQLPVAALEERIDQEMEKNPTLELRDADNDAMPTNDENADRTNDNERDLVVKDNAAGQDEFERLDRHESDDDDFGRYDYVDAGRRRTSYDDEDPKLQALSNTAAREASLTDYLRDQWELMKTDDVIRQCGLMIIERLEADGYFRSTFGDLAGTVTPEPLPQQWEQALLMVQRLDPPGVAARTLQECLLLQLMAYEGEHELAKEIVRHYFEELQKQQYTRIAQAVDSDPETVRAEVEFIRTRLIPHPGLTIGSENVPHIVPDVIIEYDDHGQLVIRIVDDRLPDMYISGHYRRMLQDDQVDRQTKQFIRSNIQSANWLIEAIEQRRNTLRRVTQQVVDAQTEFFEHGPKSLKPLPMTGVAENLGIHVATVSRAVSGKHVATPRGTFPLRMFFSGGTETADGESMSWDAVRAKIQEYIDGEDKSNPLNDDQIVELLKKDGIDIARRTVAKYRGVMNIPSSVKRRES